MAFVQQYNQFGFGRKLLIAITTYAATSVLLFSVFSRDEHEIAAGSAVLFGILSLPALVVPPVLARRVLHWPVHAVPLMALAAMGVCFGLAVVSGFDGFRNQLLAIWAVLLVTVGLFLTAGLRLMRNESDETAYFPVTGKALLGVLTVVLILRLFFDWTRFDDGRDLLAAGPVIAVAVGLGYLAWHREPLAWLLWPLGAIFGGMTFAWLSPA
jgi:hypothetical protein